MPVSDRPSPPPVSEPALEPALVSWRLVRREPWAANRSRWGLVAVLALIAVLLGLQYLLPYTIERCQYAATRGRQRAEYEAAQQGLRDLSLTSLSQAYQLVSQRVGPSVVHIRIASATDRDLPVEFSQLFGTQPHEPEGQGSGVIMDPQGYIVTNYHVVHGASAVQVSLSDGRVLRARIVGTDTLTDLAVLKIEANHLVPAEWGDSEALQVGALVWAVGSPFGLQSTITSGILSAKHRSGLAGEVYQDFLQTDAAVNPGNSGGPLVDAHGRVIGINTAIVGEVYQGVSFAIPSSIAKEVFQRLAMSGQIARGWLGVQLREVSDEDARRYQLPAKQGAVIAHVIDNPNLPTPALAAGLLAGDVVVQWNGQPIGKPAELIRSVAMTQVGSLATVVVYRDGERLELDVTIVERPASLDM